MRNNLLQALLPADLAALVADFLPAWEWVDQRQWAGAWG